VKAEKHPTHDIIEAQFELLDELGRGGTSTVYRAKERETGDIMAVKIIIADDEDADHMRLRERFIEEARVHARLQHPNTISVYAYDGHGNTFFIAMEYVDATPLIDIIEKEAPLEPERVVHIARQICGSLTEAHSNGIIHRDMKPENVLITNVDGDENYVKIIDFGLAKKVGTNKHLTQAGVAVGSPTFMAPEQVELRKDLDERVDIYALGALIYGALSGRAPFDTGSAIDRMIDKTEKPPPTMSEKVPGIVLPDGLEKIVMRCIARDRDERYPSMEALDRVLAAWQGDPMTAEALETEIAPLPGQKRISRGTKLVLLSLTMAIVSLMATSILIAISAIAFLLISA